MKSRLRRKIINFYYAIDGDDIGKKLEKYVLLNDMTAVTGLSKSIETTLKKIEKYFLSKGATIVFCGGDSLLACSRKLIDIPTNVFNTEEISFSIGIANTPSLSLLALKKAKGLGKNRVESLVGGLQ